MDLWTFGGADKFGLRHARLKVVVLQPTVISSFGCFVFEFWVLQNQNPTLFERLECVARSIRASHKPSC